MTALFICHGNALFKSEIRYNVQTKIPNEIQEFLNQIYNAFSKI